VTQFLIAIALCVAGAVMTVEGIQRFTALVSRRRAVGDLWRSGMAASGRCIVERIAP
jgi:hypothetical protein